MRSKPPATAQTCRIQRSGRDLARAERLEADADSVDRWRMAMSVDPDDHRVYENEIRPRVFEYLAGRLPGLARSGKLQERAGKLKAPGYFESTAHMRMGDDDIDDLGLALTVAVDRRLRETLKTKWDGRRPGATNITSWATNLAALMYPRQLKRILSQKDVLSFARRDLALIDPSDEDLARSGVIGTDPAITVSMTHEIEIHLDHSADEDPRDREILILDLLDFSDAEIAELLETTVKVVEYRLQKLRNSARLRRAEDDFRDALLFSA